MKPALLNNPRWQERLALWDNPILVKEIRTRMRGNRAFLLLTAHLLILALALLAVFLIIRASLGSGGNLEMRGAFGKIIFGFLVWMELVMISFTAPALTSGAISLERERQTFDLLKVTLLKPRSLTLGKYLSGLIFIFLLLVSAMPLFSLAFILGGVSLEEILIAVFILATSAISFCAIGLFFSSLFARSLISTILSYAFAIFSNFGIPLLMLFSLILFGTVISSRPNNPFDTPSFFVLAAVYLAWLVISLTPLPTIAATEVALLNGQGAWVAHFPVGNTSELFFISPWVIYVVFYILLSLALIWMSIKLVARSER